MQIKILDTGYLNTSKTGTKFGFDDRAGVDASTGTTVTAFTLDVNGDMTIAGSVNIDNQPVIGATTENSGRYISTQNRAINMNCILKKSDATAGYYINQLYQFLRLERTKGLKLIYPTTVTDTNKTIIEELGEVNINGSFADGTPTDGAGTVSTTTPYLVGRVTNIRVSDSTQGDYWRISFNFVLEG